MLLIDDVLCSMPHINTQIIGAQNIKMVCFCSPSCFFRHAKCGSRVLHKYSLNTHTGPHNYKTYAKHVQHMP